MSQYTSVYSHAFVTARLRAQLKRVVPALLAAVALVLGMGAPVAAAAPVPGTLSGTISSSSGPVGFAWVEAYGPDIAYDYTAADGEYSMTLDPGTYTVCVYADDYAQQCVNGVVVASGQTTDKDFTLKDYGHVAGTVTGVGGANLQGVRVYGYSYNELYDDWDYWDGDSTDSNGTYQLDLPEGDYAIQFRGKDGYRTEFYDDAAGFEDATLTTVTENTTVTRNAQLTRTAGISGHVDAADGDPSRGMVNIFNAETGRLKRTARINGDGDYALWNLAPGTYKIAFNRLSGYAVSEARFYDGKHEFQGLAAANVVTVGVDETVSGIDAALVPGGAVAGVLRDNAGDPLGGCLIQAYQPGPNPALVTRSGWTEEDGTFRVPGLSTGDYQLRVVDDRDFSSNCDGGTQFYAGPDGVLTKVAEDAESVAVTVGATVDLANPLIYKVGGRITGTVTLPSGASNGDRRLFAVDLDTHRVVARTRVEEDGSYVLRGLQGGSYRVVFNRLSGQAFSAAQFFDGKADGNKAIADPVSVGAGEIESGIDAALAEGGTINGRLVSRSGDPLEGCHVQAFTRHGSLVTRTAYTDEDGLFTVTGLSTGDYRLRVVQRYNGDNCDAGTQLYAGTDGELSSDWHDSATIAVTLGAATALANDLVYTRGGTISGKVTFPAGADRFSDGSLRIVDKATGEVVKKIRRVQPDGRFSVDGLLPGSYRVAFNRVSGFATAAAQFYNGKAENLGFGAANLIDLGPEETFSNANATLAAGGRITGTLVDGAGNPLSCQVQAFTRHRSLVTRTAYSGADGEFEIGGLTTGQYLVRVLPDGDDCHEGRQFVVGGGGVLADVVDDADAVSVTIGNETALAPDLVYGSGDPVVTIVNTVDPSITGTPQVGQTLTALPGTWTPGDVTFAYQWRLNGADVAGATGTTYTPVATDAGKTVRVRVTASKPGLTSVSETSAATAAVAAAPADTAVNTAPPVVSGTAQVGKTLTASTGTWTPSGLTYAYAWKVAGTPVAGATNSSFVVPATAVGKTVTVAVTASKPGLTSASATSAPTGAVTAATFSLTKAPSIKGKAKVGKTLKYKAGTISPTATVTFQWLRNGKVIKKATAAKYKLVKKDKGKKISLRVTYSQVGYTTLVSTTKQTGKVAL